MTSALAWLAAAGAIWLLPTGRAEKRRGHRRSKRAPWPRPAGTSRTGDGRTASSQPSRHALPVLGAGATAAVCLVLVGLPAGAGLAGVAAPAVAWGVERLQVRPVRRAPDRNLALVLDLTAAALRAGQPIAAALAQAAPAGTDQLATALARVSGLLRLGAEPAEAWSGVADDGLLGSVAAVACRSATSGIRLASAFERHAEQIRADLGAAAAVRAHRAGVLAMAPLGLCFLPSFVCLGIVPVVVGIAKSALGGLP